MFFPRSSWTQPTWVDSARIKLLGLTPAPVSEAEAIIVGMAEHQWAPPEHQDVPIYQAESLPLDQIGDPEQLPSPEPVRIDRLRFEQIGELERVKAFAVARSDVAVFVEIAWQGGCSVRGCRGVR